jgi:hypothetical protein
MPSTLDQEIRAQLARLLHGEIDLETFEEWLTPATWDVGRSSNAAAQALASELLLKLAEFTNGDWTEEELRELWQPYVPSWSGQLQQRFGSAATVTRSGVAVQARFGLGGKAHSVVSG